MTAVATFVSKAIHEIVKGLLFPEKCFFLVPEPECYFAMKLRPEGGLIGIDKFFLDK